MQSIYHAASVFYPPPPPNNGRDKVILSALWILQTLLNSSLWHFLFSSQGPINSSGECRISDFIPRLWLTGQWIDIKASIRNDLCARLQLCWLNLFRAAFSAQLSVWLFIPSLVVFRVILFSSLLNTSELSMMMMMIIFLKYRVENIVVVVVVFYLSVWVREIEAVYSARIPALHAQASCRCPPSHPRVHPVVERYCIPNGADDTTSDRMLRLHPHAHPLNYVNDNDISTTWVSSVFPSPEKLDQGVLITIDLEGGQYQVA